MSHGMSHGMSPHSMAAPSYSFTNNTSASSAQNKNFNESDQLYKYVLEQANGNRIQMVSKHKYIIHYNNNFRRIFERHPHMHGFITQTNNYGSLHKTENDFDEKIRRLIDSRMRSGVTRLSELRELCIDTYKRMFNEDIPEEKLSELVEGIMLNPRNTGNGTNIFFRKLK